MTNLELKRTEVELIRVAAARAELEFKIIEREDEIERIRENIQAQLKREEELRIKISDAKMAKGN
jgi:hypothetical protein